MGLEMFESDSTDSICDVKVERQVLSHREIWQGRVISLQVDDVCVAKDAAPVTREYVGHPGAVAIVALRGQVGQEEVLLERQYRHPVGAQLWEIPAGLLDVEGEDPLVAAQRELREEVDMVARQWDVLLDYFTSPGGSNESIRVFLARDLEELEDPFDREDEEASMVATWVSLDDAVSLVLNGSIHNPNATQGIMAAFVARSRDWQTLRQPSEPWFR
ncbi:NUDIX domain-containing protein [Schaalia vaccimaxillae]|uniref:NUDIX domain-containing protein n=1 Tax=Schaalia vaccimaxillae TaxID=183916 RepID=UPI0003B2F631|nr:NUDIX hydrolase [Schaalia vaccimaxillae]